MTRPVHIAALMLGITLTIVCSQTASSQPPLIGIRGGNPVLSVTSGIAGGQPIPVVNANARLDYRRSAFTSKITVSTACPGQNFTLRVFATGVTLGAPAPEVMLLDGMPAMDFVVGIPGGAPNPPARCNLRYTASATFEQGNSLEFGNDVHTVTYTVVAQ
jgi:hypothetical protein